jgi:hypothetical protein
MMPVIVIPAKAGIQPDIVIPAKAGIQAEGLPRGTGAWSPAFAGMTGHAGMTGRNRRAGL